MKKEMKVGIFFSTALLIFIVFVLLVGDVGNIFKKKGYELYAYFDSVAGLENGTPVRLAGVKIGKVDSIGLEKNRAKVKLQIDTDFKVQKDAKVTQASLGLLGEKYVEIVSGQGSLYCNPGDFLEGAASMSFDQISTKIGDIGKEITETSRSFREILKGEGSSGGLNKVLDNMNFFVQDLSSFLKENKKGIGNSINEASGVFEKIDSKLETLSDNLDSLVLELKGMVDENRDPIKKNLDKMNDLFQKMEKSLNLLNNSLEKINSGEGSLGKVIQNPDLYDQTEKTMNSVNRIIEPISSFRLSANLQAYHLMTSQNLKSIMGLTFWLSSSKFFSAQIIRDPWENQFKYSAQGGYRWEDFSARAGIMESRFGIGVDYFVFDDRVRISLDSYDFNLKPSPKFRLQTSFFPSKHFYLLGGIENFLVNKKREVFLGFGFGIKP